MRGPERQEQQLEESRADQRAEPATSPPAQEAAQILERALGQVESLLGKLEDGAAGPTSPKEEPKVMPNELTELRRALREVVRRLEDALDHLGIEAQRLSDEASRISLVADRLEAHLTAPIRTYAPDTRAPTAESAPEPEPATPPEPQFAAGGPVVDVVVAAVPGFQGLMDVQRGLSSLPGVEGASVHSYRDGEASLGIALRAPVSARQIVEGLQEATGHGLIIEESRPEDMRLRLRFSNHTSPGRSAERLG